MEPALQGASCTTGGIIRGKAHGNVLSLADAPEVLGDKLKLPEGEVRVFTSLVDPTDVKATLVVKATTDTSLIVILKQMRKKYCPMEGKYSTLIFIHLIHILIHI